MDSSWFTVTDTPTSSSDESNDSDRIDSDVEAELYSMVHHDTSVLNEDNFNDSEEANINPNLLSSERNTETQPLLDNQKRCYAKISTAQSNALIQKQSNCEIILTNDHAGTNHNHTSSTIIKSLANQNASNKFPLNNRNIFIQVSDSDSDDNSNKIVKKSLTSKNRYNKFLSYRNLANIQHSQSDSDDSVIFSEEIAQESFNTAISNNLYRNNKNSRNYNDVSESDSSVNVWSEPEETDIKLNFSSDIVVISSDSEDSALSENDHLSEICRNKNLHLNENFGKDPWFIFDTDLYRPRRGSQGRYHERALQNCTKCNLNGHTFKFCPTPKETKCYVCGGSHNAISCNLRVCLSCLQLGHDLRRCPHLSIIYSNCKHCGTRGHNEKICPDLWRRYHNTTAKNGDITQPRTVNKELVHENLYCYNCGSSGHSGIICDARRMDHFCCRTWPTVISYATPARAFRQSNAVQQAENAAPAVRAPPQSRSTWKKRKRGLLQTKARLLRARERIDKMNPDTPKAQRMKKRNAKKLAYTELQLCELKQLPKSFPRTPKSKANGDTRTKDTQPQRKKKKKKKGNIQKQSQM